MKKFIFILFLILSLGCSKGDLENQSGDNSEKENVVKKVEKTERKSGEKPQKKGEKKEKTKKIVTKKVKKTKNYPEYIEKGDFDAILKRGYLRIITPPKIEAEYLPRKGALSGQEIESLKQFAKQNKLKTAIVYTDSYDQLFNYLIEGKGDIIAANLTATEDRVEKIGFTNALTNIKELLISHKDSKKVEKIEDLANRKIAVRKSSTYYKTAQELKKKVPTLEIIEVDETLDTEEILYKVSLKEYDLTIADSNLFGAVKVYSDSLVKNIELTESRAIAWGVRKDSVELKKKLDQFINLNHIDLWHPRVYDDDWDKISKKKVIRVITRNNATSYFLYKGRLFGFEYELAKYFAKKHNLRLEIIVPEGGDDLVPSLLEGKGDIIAASVTNGKFNNDKVAYSRFYNKVSEVLITHISDKTIEKVEDLKGRTVVVRKSSSYYQTLQKLKKDGIDFKIVEAPEEMETEEIIQKVGSKEYDLTVADEHIFKTEQVVTKSVKSVLSLKDDIEHSWVVRKNNPKLLKILNDFFNKEYKGLHFNIIYNKYFKNDRRVKKLSKLRSDRTGMISPYDHLVKKYAKRYKFNWTLLVSQMYQESRFNPKAKSWVGAKGLMQVMPRTGKEMGFTKLEDPEIGVHAGVKYMSRMRNRFDDKLPPKDRLWFTLASYNAGFGHVLDARRVAKMSGLNPNKWFGNVEKAMLMLSKPKYYKKVRYGYCRCTEPVKYVSEIKTRYEFYLNSLDSDKK